MRDEIEAIARDLRRRLGLDDAQFALAPTIAVQLLGPRAIAHAPSLWTSACLSKVNGEYRIFIRDFMPDLNFVIAHEVAHFVLREFADYSGTNEERAASALAAAIIAPPAAVARAYAAKGEQLGALARLFAMSKTGVVLRLGEVRREPRAVVTRSGNVMSRGEYVWEPGQHDGPGIVRAKLRGGIDEGRVALRFRR